MEERLVAQAVQRRGRSIGVAAVVVVAWALASAPSVLAQSYWFETCERAVDLIDGGRFEEAAPLLDRLLKDRPVPASGIRVPGDRFIEYQPYFQLARIQVQQGDVQGAVRSLDISESFAVAQGGPRAREDQLRLRRQIAAMERERAAVAGAAGGR